MLEPLLYIVFVLTALLLVAVILLQEGKGGGLSDAFGGAGTETFGVRSGGINKFTFGLFGVFVLSAMLIHWTSEQDPNAGSVLGGQAGAAPLANPNAPGGSANNPIQITKEQLDNLQNQLPDTGGGK